MNYFRRLKNRFLSIIPRFRRRVILEVRRGDPPPELPHLEGVRFEQVTSDNVDMISHYCDQSEMMKRRKNIDDGVLGMYAFCGDRVVGQGWAEIPGDDDRLLWNFLPVTKDTLPFRSFSIDPQYRGRKIFQHLLRQLAVLCFRKTSVNRILSHVYEDNVISLAGCERAGFRRICVIPFIEWRGRLYPLKKIPEYMSRVSESKDSK